MNRSCQLTRKAAFVGVAHDLEDIPSQLRNAPPVGLFDPNASSRAEMRVRPEWEDPLRQKAGARRGNPSAPAVVNSGHSAIMNAPVQCELKLAESRDLKVITDMLKNAALGSIRLGLPWPDAQLETIKEYYSLKRVLDDNAMCSMSAPTAANLRACCPRSVMPAHIISFESSPADFAELAERFAKDTRWIDVPIALVFLEDRHARLRFEVLSGKPR